MVISVKKSDGKTICLALISLAKGQDQNIIKKILCQGIPDANLGLPTTSVSSAPDLCLFAQLIRLNCWKSSSEVRFITLKRLENHGLFPPPSINLTLAYFSSQIHTSL